MEILINPEFKDKDEIIFYLKTVDAVSIDEYLPLGGIDISKFLKPDKSLNLELIEIAIEFLATQVDTIYVGGLLFYYIDRGIERDEDKKEEECVFIYNFIKALVDEYKEHNVEVILA